MSGRIETFTQTERVNFSNEERQPQSPLTLRGQQLNAFTGSGCFFVQRVAKKKPLFEGSKGRWDFLTERVCGRHLRCLLW